MSFDKPGAPHSRDTALARLLAEALGSRSKPADHAEISACPDAEILAAYADQGLAAEETVRWESHFADCGRCQKIIAVLAASGEELTPAEVQRLGTRAAASAASHRGVRSTVAPWIAIWRTPVLWRWLVPAVGLASAVLWFALRQTPPQQILTAQKTTPATAAQSETPREAPAASSPKSDERQIAQANLPAPPAASPRSETRLRDKEVAQPKPSFDAERQQPGRNEKSVQSAAQAPSVSELDKSEPREESAKDNRARSPESAGKKSQTDTLSAAAPPVAPAAPPPASPSVGGVDRAATELKALAKAAAPAIVFASPNRASLWRVGPGGRIERSSDQGQTWQQQASGVTADLLAGAAPSEKIAWAVGRGVILRTEDGDLWQRVMPPSTAQPIAPSNPAPDWIGVEARDASRATITSRDQRRFLTEDGGRTWVPVQ